MTIQWDHARHSQVIEADLLRKACPFPGTCLEHPTIPRAVCGPCALKLDEMGLLEKEGT